MVFVVWKYPLQNWVAHRADLNVPKGTDLHIHEGEFIAKVSRCLYIQKKLSPPTPDLQLVVEKYKSP